MFRRSNELLSSINTRSVTQSPSQFRNKNAARSISPGQKTPSGQLGVVSSSSSTPEMIIPRIKKLYFV